MQLLSLPPPSRTGSSEPVVDGAPSRAYCPEAVADDVLMSAATVARTFFIELLADTCLLPARPG
eukprot:2948397-Pyramimonas_sp.AAC.1